MNKIILAPEIKFSALILALFIFIPKIDLFSIPNYAQGIRLEDIFLFFFTISLIQNQKIFYDIKKNFEFWPGFILFTYLLLSNLISIINGSDVLIFMLLRLCEYIILLLFVSYVHCTKKFIYQLICSYVLLNLIIVILQYYQIIGSISSRGYLTPEHHLNQRAYGLAGGSWELAILLTLSFFIIMRNSKNYIRDYIFFVPIIFFQISLAYSKTSIISFSLFTLFFLPEFFRRINLQWDYSKKLIFFITIIIVVCMFLLSFNLSNISSISIITNLDYQNFYILLSDFYSKNYIPPQQQVDESLYSFWHRLLNWQEMISEYKSSYSNIIFGTGFVKYLYLESTYIRVITSFGIIGTAIIIYYIISIRLYLLIYLLIVGFSFDIFVSFKILLFYLLLFKNFKNESKIKKKLK